MRILALAAAVLAACSVPAPTDAGSAIGEGGAGPSPPVYYAAEVTGITIQPIDAAGWFVDAGVPDAATCACSPVECRLAACDGEGCLYADAPDGTPCFTDPERFCVGAACSYGVCGDRYREPGPDPAREGCDDGNLEGGDACSPDCRPAVLVVSSRPGEEDLPGSTSVAADDAGRLLFVWGASVGEGLEVRARRYDAAGVELVADEVLVLARGGSAGEALAPAVVGLASGWAVVWSSPGIDASEAGIAYALVPPSGAPSVPRRANEHALGRQAAPAAARLGAGFVVAWADESGTVAPPGSSRLRLRSLDARGRVLGPERALSPDGTSAREVTLASSGATVLAAWTEDASDPFARSRVVARRLGAVEDATPFAPSAADGAAPHAAWLASGDFSLVWVSRDADARGDVHARVVRAAGEPLAGTTHVALTWTPPGEVAVAELAPRAAALAGDDFVVAYERGGRRRGVALLTPGASGLAPESSMLAEHLQDGLQGDVTLLTTARGLWVAWSDASGLGAAGAHRSFVAYLLPPS
ncbi:MAG: hypothetical protein KF729_36805 [Sandaracinaceae bacterium]|nr:hypothetical protein [Sandaracinaceae bacterium]